MGDSPACGAAFAEEGRESGEPSGLTLPRGCDCNSAAGSDDDDDHDEDHDDDDVAVLPLLLLTPPLTESARDAVDACARLCAEDGVGVVVGRLC